MTDTEQAAYDAAQKEIERLKDEIRHKDCKCSNTDADDINKLVLLAFYNVSERYRQENANAITALTEPPKPFKFGGENE